jgi:transglutaminase-like putative cysteine protease
VSRSGIERRREGREASAGRATAPAAGAAPRVAGAGLLARLTQRLTRDKADTLLLLAAALLVLAPHAGHLPPWASGVAVAALLWRASLTLRGRRMPPLWLLLPISLAAMACVFLSYRTLLGRDAGVAMLALLLSFKLLEMHARRDLFVVIFISFFLLLTNFFYSQSMVTALSMVATLILLLTTLMTFQYTGVVPPLAQRLRTAGKIFLIAAPLAILLFFAFPRIQGPLWGLPGDAHSGHSGMSETMSPGSMSSLAMSDEVAFRVFFHGTPPRQDQLYWRGIVLGDYDGQTWTRAGQRYRRAETTVQVRGQPLRHEITLEPTGQRWLFALELTDPRLGLDGAGSDASEAMELRLRAPLQRRLRYEASAYLEHTLQGDLSEEQQAPWLHLPPGANPRTLALAATLRHPGDTPASAQAVLAMFRQQHFFYTLEPPLLGRNAVDDFLFDSRAGFCEHYAGAFVVLMRAMGIPARVVTGYQGGELNPVDGYLTVRQSDAHAWAEIWLAGRGWLRIDPTAAVAPERVQHNLGRALPQPAPFGLDGLGALMNFRNDGNSWLGQLRFQLNAVNNAWNQWVLDYNPDRQRSFLEELGLAMGNWRNGAALLALGALLVLVRRLRAQAGLDPVDAAYAAFCRQMAGRGMARALHEGPHSYARRLLAMDLPEEQRAAVRGFLELYGALKYAAPAEERTTSVQRLATLLKRTR